MKSIKFLVVLLSVIVTGCTYSVHDYHISDYDSNSKSGSTKIEVNTEQFVILGFIGNVDYVYDAYQELTEQCVGGTIDGIHTRYSTSHSFLSYTNKIYIQANCHL